MFFLIISTKVLSAPQDPLLRSSHSADTRRRRQPSSSPPYYPGSDGNLSTSSSTGSLKRRRSNRKNRSDLQFESTQEQFKFSEGDGIDTAQKRLKGLNLALYPKNPYRHLSWKIGEQVEAIKWTGDAKEWYCARVVEILNDINDEFL
ncbi:hypothetical protein CU098_010286, partial [Rhizopus stolonifer]